MRKIPQSLAAVLVLVLLAFLSGVVPDWAEARGRKHRNRSEPVDLYDAYRVDALDPISGGVPSDVQVLTDAGPRAWPNRVREDFERRVREEWSTDRIYGPVHANLGMWLSYPLVTARVGGRVLVPVIDRERLPISGRLELPESNGPRRVIVLVDASASANSRTAFQGPNGRTVQIPVLEAERRALDHLIEMLDGDTLEIGVIAFGESTWPIIKPGRDPEALRNALARFRREFPRGDGRTDAVCALWSARDWLEDTPSGMDREIVLLTDGDLPHSGRFTECRMSRASKNRDTSACEARRNVSPCPSSHVFGRGDGMSDIVQMASFGRKNRRKLRVHPLVFEADRSARVWQQLARRTRGRMVRVPSPAAIEVALPALVSRSIKGLFARNVTTGNQTQDLLGEDRSHFTGELQLQQGANDVEIRVESERGLSGLFRFRVYSEPGYLKHYLAELRDENESLKSARDTLVEDARSQGKAKQIERQRKLEIEIPAAPRR